MRAEDLVRNGLSGLGITEIKVHSIPIGKQAKGHESNKSRAFEVRGRNKKAAGGQMLGGRSHLGQAAMAPTPKTLGKGLHQKYKKGGLVEIPESKIHHMIETAKRKKGGAMHKGHHDRREHHFIGSLIGAALPLIGKAFGFSEGGEVKRAAGGQMLAGAKGALPLKNVSLKRAAGGQMLGGNKGLQMIAAKRARGGQMLAGKPMPMKADGGNMSAARSDFKSSHRKGGRVHREHHFLGALAGAALPMLANLAGGAIGSLFNKKAEGGEVKRRKGGCIKRAMGGSGKERKGEI